MHATAINKAHLGNKGLAVGIEFSTQRLLAAGVVVDVEATSTWGEFRCGEGLI